ncbi:MAG TPA: TOBE domain-containing protein, partial [Cyanophyceae cyanobacterium]
GIRPEDVHLAKPDDQLTLQGRIFLVENLGMQNLISVRVNGSELRLRALLPTHQMWETEDVTLSIAPESIHWFDITTGDRIPNNSQMEPGRVRQSTNLQRNDNGLPIQRQFTNN